MGLGCEDGCRRDEIVVSGKQWSRQTPAPFSKNGCADTRAMTSRAALAVQLLFFSKGAYNISAR